MRNILFWLHLCAGVTAGIVIFIMSVTGVLLTYEKQMILWFDLRDLPAVQGGARLPVDQLLTEAKAQRGSLPASIAISGDPSVPAQLAYGREFAYQDPTTGKILGGSNAGARQFFRRVTDWHRWLATSTENRATGRLITGVCNLAFLFIVVSGAYLWLPRVWTAASVRAIAWFRGGLTGKARDFNWHNVIGIWCCIPLAFIVAGAAVISFPWASNLVYQVTGTSPPAPAPAAAAPTGQRGGPKADPDLNGLEERWKQAVNEAVPGWRLMTMRIPASDRAPVSFVIDHGYGGQPQKRLTLTLDRASGIVKSRESFDDFNRGRQARTWLRFVHTGEYYGIPGQTIAGIASLGGAVLAFTGMALSVRRFAAWRSRRARASVEVAS